MPEIVVRHFMTDDEGRRFIIRAPFEQPTAEKDEAARRGERDGWRDPRDHDFERPPSLPATAVRIEPLNYSRCPIRRPGLRLQVVMRRELAH
jgi:hypothetical protein